MLSTQISRIGKVFLLVAMDNIFLQWNAQAQAGEMVVLVIFILLLTMEPLGQWYTKVLKTGRPFLLAAVDNILLLALILAEAKYIIRPIMVRVGLYPAASARIGNQSQLAVMLNILLQL